MTPAPHRHDFEAMSWRKLACPRSELRLDLVLRCGQSFRWVPRPGKEGEWAGALAGRAWLLAQDEENVLYKCFPKTEDSKADAEVLKDYFQLDVKLSPLYERWTKVDPIFKRISAEFSGIRMLRQDPVENLFSFICSSNNNISRISSMVENLSKHYGDQICETDFGDNAADPTPFHSFPTVDALAANPSALEKRLRSLGFGYRAGYIAKTATALQKKGGRDFLLKLREADYEDAREELLELSGIGPKVADCILLMSLDKHSSIPVDTHMFQIAASKYLPHLRANKTVTNKVYAEVAGHFRELYGEYSGWAHSVLFSADLKHLQTKNEDSPTKAKRKRKS